MATCHYSPHSYPLNGMKSLNSWMSMIDEFAGSKLYAAVQSKTSCKFTSILHNCSKLCLVLIQPLLFQNCFPGLSIPSREPHPSLQHGVPQGHIISLWRRQIVSAILPLSVSIGHVNQLIVCLMQNAFRVYQCKMLRFSRISQIPRYFSKYYRWYFFNGRIIAHVNSLWCIFGISVGHIGWWHYALVYTKSLHLCKLIPIYIEIYYECISV